MIPILEVQQLSKRYGDVVAVDGVDLTVNEGEIFGILGLNGAGKTTMVECAQGLRRPDAGSVRLLGRDPATRSERARLPRVGSQLQDSNLPERMRVSEAVKLFADRRVSGTRWASGGSTGCGGSRSARSRAVSANGCSSPWRS